MARGDESTHMRYLASTIAHLLHWWWRSDRIRAPPGEGRLLRLAPGDFLRIASESAQVVSRQVMRDGDEPLIVYRCETATASVELVVRLAGGIHIRRSGLVRQVAPDDVEAIPRCSRRSSS